MAPDDAPAAHPPVGSVAQETARLLEALFGTPDATDEPSPADPGPAAGAPSPPAATPCPTCGHTGVGSDHGSETGPAGGERSDPGPVCRICPVCQVLRVVRTVRPETLDRLADLAAAVTETLRDAAVHRWGETSTADGTGAARPARTPVQDIAVVGDGDAEGPDDLDEAGEGR